MPKPLVIVESPAKARTIAGFLGSRFVVEASIGHIRDLPRNASEVPAKLKGIPWARLGVDVDNDFAPLYVVPKEKRDQVRKLKHLLSEASELFLATDEDREGESISWHLSEVLQAEVPVRRLVFHEITASAIREALEHPRDLDLGLVDAQEARRILDRLYGYEVSPVLWKKIQPKLSAGRVQSVATRMLVERERERMRFRSASFWDLEGEFAETGSSDSFTADLAELDGRRLAAGKDFALDGDLTSEDVLVLDEPEARQLADELRGAEFMVASVQRKPYRRSPYAPFRTSTLQQEAARKLRFSSARTMIAAQRLYEGGFITYMRTDSTALSDAAVAEARRLVAQLYGDQFLPTSPRIYQRQVRNAQEAHEAIRPSGDHFFDPKDVSRQTSADEGHVYELIWKRTVASQMEDAVGESALVRIEGTSPQGSHAAFTTKGRVITFPGFLRAYVVDRDDPTKLKDDQERPLPALEEGDRLDVHAMEPKGHQTKPPARYTEATLVRSLEQMGVGRPSTYSTIISTVQDRGYAWKHRNALVPSLLAFATVGLLEGHFPDLVDYAFTARMEDDLDTIARGETTSTPWLSRFYFGNGQVGLRTMVSDRLDEIDARAVNSIPIGSDDQGRPIVARVGKYGPYLQRGETTAAIPERMAPDELTVEKSTELLDAPSGDKILGTDPDTGLTVLARNGRFGPYVQLGDTEEIEDGSKPKTASLFKDMELDQIGLEEALHLLTLPRVVGTDPETGTEITAQNGRYGPYLRRGKETRGLQSEEQLFTISLEASLELFAQPPQRRGRATPLREIGEHPETGKAIELREGRYGLYVTDGEVNASLRQSDDAESLTLERALELLAARRERMKKGRRAT